MPARWVFREAGSFAAMSLDTVRAAFRRPVQWREFVQQLWFVASVSILPTCLVAIPFGAIIALQTGALIRQLGAVSLNGGASVVAVVREASPIVTALIIAGAAGSAICADLGARKIRDEIDAMETRRADDTDQDRRAMASECPVGAGSGLRRGVSRASGAR